MDTNSNEIVSLTYNQTITKRTFDLIFPFIGILFLWWIILLAWIVASLNTKSNGFFFQKRVGMNGYHFEVVKIKTMKQSYTYKSNITLISDPRITKFGHFLRRTKIDELPQLFNILLGHMSFVGPRPDVPGYADKLEGKNRVILSMRPGITGPASLKYRNEEKLLNKKNNPEMYNDQVIWPDKVRINIEYIKCWSLKKDVLYILKTVFK